MDEPLKFDYYKGNETEQYSFYRIPRVLFKDKRFKKLSVAAKLLYGLMLDRMSLSMKNGWFDDEGRAYIIYTIENIMEDLGCSKETAVKVLGELASGKSKGIGLVEKVRRGLGKPDIIYVKNFIIKDNEGKKEENEPSNAHNSTEVGKSDFWRSENPTSRVRQNRLQEVGKSDPNYTNMNYTNLSYTNPINQPADEIDLIDSYRTVIRSNIEYDILCERYRYKEVEMINEIIELMVECICSKKKTVRISGEEKPREVVKSQFLKINENHIEYILTCLKENPSDVRNIKSYLLTTIYNAPMTIDNFYSAQVNHDLYG